jgi:3'(2'), 5'-bisphosphate nucleotidase
MDALSRPPASDAGFAQWAAQRAGAALLGLREELGYGDPAALGVAGDLRSNGVLTRLIAEFRPGDAVLSEEAVRDNPGRLDAERVWIIDPLDGTREFTEPGRTDWAVHVALWHRLPRLVAGPAATAATAGAVPGPRVSGSPAPRGALAAGAVALPARFQVYATDAAPAYPTMRTPGARLRIATSRTRPPAFLAALATALGCAELVPMGSAGAKVCAVISGEVDAYVHAGGQYEWDSAAPVAVARATGLHASRIEGSRLEYNQADPWLPDIVVCRKDLAPRLLAALADCVAVG